VKRFVKVVLIDGITRSTRSTRSTRRRDEPRVSGGCARWSCASQRQDAFWGAPCTPCTPCTPSAILIQHLFTKDTLKPGDGFERQGQLESAGLSSGFSGSDT